jgi:SpoVK/Ycf46/Vps4 family AAA+-type ATPase
MKLHPLVAPLEAASDADLMASVLINLSPDLFGGDDRPLNENDQAFVARVRIRWDATNGELPLRARERRRLLAILDRAARFSEFERTGRDPEFEALVEAMEADFDEGQKFADMERDLDLSLGLLNCDRDIPDLLDRVAVAPDQRGLRFLFFGPPGTGKSVLAKLIACRVRLKPRVLQIGEILRSLVGETEANIAGAFADAARDEVMLIIDEVDSFLVQRAAAAKSWEITQVNAFLTALDSHPLPVVATTNLMDIIDPAAHRRFLFQVRFDFLKPTQVKEAFRTFFGLDPPTGVADLAELTPADFDLVRRRAEVLGTQGDQRWLVRELEHLKPATSNPKLKIGFHA